VKRLLPAVLILFNTYCTSAQENDSRYVASPFNLGIGVGLDYGGIGIKIPMISFAPWAQLFGGLGYNGAGAGFNSGVLIRSSPQNQISTYFTAMYGYNAVLIAESVGGKQRTERTYYGTSFGCGIEFRNKPEASFFTFGLLFPIRSEKFNNASGTVNPLRRPKEVVLSIGYHFAFKRHRES
jgi:hypothetical protein